MKNKKLNEIGKRLDLILKRLEQLKPAKDSKFYLGWKLFHNAICYYVHSLYDSSYVLWIGENIGITKGLSQYDFLESDEELSNLVGSCEKYILEYK